jgi:hypothetical protein
LIFRKDVVVMLDERGVRRGFALGHLDCLTFALALVIFVGVEQQMQPRHHLFDRRQLRSRRSALARRVVRHWFVS